MTRRYSWRAWRRTPGSLAAALIALALGLGANATVFSIVSGVLLKPLPYADPDRLVMVWQDMRARGGPEREWASPGLFVEWQRRATAFEHLAAVRGWMPNLTGTDEPERLRGAAVSHGYFAALGVPPMLGRVLSEDDDRPEASPVAVVGHALWTRRFGADPTLVGRTILLDGQAAAVVGIMPASFRPPILDADIFTTIRINPAQAPRGMIVLRVMGKLKPGIPWPRPRPACPPSRRSSVATTGMGERQGRRSCRSTTTWLATSGRCSWCSRPRWHWCC